MTNSNYDLVRLAEQVMKDRGLQPDFSQQVLQQLSTINAPATEPPKCDDLRQLLWCSIDNDDSRDLDQLTYAKKDGDGRTTIFIAVAAVEAVVVKNTPIDKHAQINTTSVYTPAKIFPMLPEKLSTNLTSLNENQDRLALVTQITVNPDGTLADGRTFQAMVHNYAKLTYNGIGAWLEGSGAVPEKVQAVPGLEQALRCQSEVAQLLKQKRHSMGALTLVSSDVQCKIGENQEVKLELPKVNLASELIEHFMIAANSVMANQLKQAKLPSLRRVVKVPQKWDQIVAIAKSLGKTLPNNPDAKALDQFLIQRKNADPETFPDLSLTIIKLLGRGEYIVQSAQDKPEGHFGLALSEYTHSTAPNRRFPDLITQRQYKAYLAQESAPYSVDELNTLAAHCTTQEDAANKVERHLTKSAAALHLASRIGTEFKGIITGAAAKGTWVRIFDPPIEGKVTTGFRDLNVGDHVRVKLVHVDVPQGFIDFSIAN